MSQLFFSFQEEPLALLGVASTPALGALSAGSDVSFLVESLLRPVSSIQLSFGWQRFAPRRYSLTLLAPRRCSQFFCFAPPDSPSYIKRNTLAQGPRLEDRRPPVGPLGILLLFLVSLALLYPWCSLIDEYQGGALSSRRGVWKQPGGSRFGRLWAVYRRSLLELRLKRPK